MLTLTGLPFGRPWVRVRRSDFKSHSSSQHTQETDAGELCVQANVTELDPPHSSEVSASAHSRDDPSVDHQTPKNCAVAAATVLQGVHAVKSS